MTKNNEWADTVSVLPGEIDTDTGPRQAFLVVVRGSNVGEAYAINPDMVIGRAAGTDLRVNDEGVSRFHCKLRFGDNGILVEDLGSRNGTYCNGERVMPGMRPLMEGDRLQIGTTFIVRFTYVESSGKISSPVLQGETHDPLTEMFSRRHFMDVLEAEVHAALEKKLSLSLVLVHLDRYADLVADHGQPLVDQLILTCTSAIRTNVDTNDLLGRLAGGDFARIARRASPGNTFMWAERLRKSTSTWLAPASERITLSAGIAAMDELRIESAHDLLVAAGSALHRARSRGGDRVVLCTQEFLGEPKRQAKV